MDLKPILLTPPYVIKIKKIFPDDLRAPSGGVSHKLGTPRPGRCGGSHSGPQGASTYNVGVSLCLHIRNGNHQEQVKPETTVGAVLGGGAGLYGAPSGK